MDRFRRQTAFEDRSAMAQSMTSVSINSPCSEAIWRGARIGLGCAVRSSRETKTHVLLRFSNKNTCSRLRRAVRAVASTFARAFRRAQTSCAFIRHRKGSRGRKIQRERNGERRKERGREPDDSVRTLNGEKIVNFKKPQITAILIIFSSISMSYL